MTVLKKLTQKAQDGVVVATPGRQLEILSFFILRKGPKGKRSGSNRELALSRALLVEAIPGRHRELASGQLGSVLLIGQGLRERRDRRSGTASNNC